MIGGNRVIGGTLATMFLGICRVLRVVQVEMRWRLMCEVNMDAWETNDTLIKLQCPTFKMLM
jgi:hypothetical protein